jgi:hypothetical protein
VQRLAVREVFGTLLQLRLGEVESDVLAGYGTVQHAVRDFLAYCGAGSGGPSPTVVRGCVPAFAAWAAMHLRRLEVSGQSKEVIPEWPQLVAVRRKGAEDLDRLRQADLRGADAAVQRSVWDVLIVEMELRAVTALLDLTIELRSIRIPNISRELEQSFQRAFADALQRLEADSRRAGRP